MEVIGIALGLLLAFITEIGRWLPLGRHMR